MDHPLHLTKDEQKLFDALSDSLKEGWEVHDETLTAFESDDVLRIRLSMARLSKFPPTERIIKDVQGGKMPTPDMLDEIPEDILPTFFFTIGAKGVAAMMWILLQKIKDDEDIQGLAALSLIRHDILATNSSINYV